MKHDLHYYCACRPKKKSAIPNYIGSMINPDLQFLNCHRKFSVLYQITPYNSESHPSFRYRKLNYNFLVSGRGVPRVTAALVGDGEGRLITTPIHKERITSRSKEDLAQEAALVLQQADSVHCVAHDNRRLPGRFSTLPVRRKEKRPEVPLDSRRRSEDLGVTTQNLTDTPKSKKKALERSHSDASAKKFKNTIAKLFSPKLERKSKPVSRSASDAGSSTRSHRKRSGSESEGSHFGTARAKKPLSPIIEASPQVDQQPFHFGNKSEIKKSKQDEGKVIEVPLNKPPKSPRKEEKIIPISIEKIIDVEVKPSLPANQKVDVDEVDRAGNMLHSSRYDQQHGEESTIHKMIHRLSNDRSPPPQLTRTMVSPGPGFGHNNNRPFSYTRPNESSPPPPQNGVIYAQVQLDKKKAQRSHSDSDEGLGLDRKDSSRENSPAEKEYRRTDYYANDLRRNNEINSFKSRYEENRKNATHFGEFSKTEFPNRSAESKRFHDFDEIDRNLFDKPDKYTSTVFVDTSSRGRADGMDARRRDSAEFSRSTDKGISSKTSELSARRDLLESRIKSRLLADEMFASKNNINVPKKSEHEIIDKPIVPSPVTPNRVASPKRYADTYITETRTSSNGEKYIFEKEIHEDNGKVYGYEKKINKVPTDAFIEPVPREGYTVETRTDKYGDKYIVETRTHEGFAEDFKPFLSDRSRNSPEEKFQRISPEEHPQRSPNSPKPNYLSEEQRRIRESRDDVLSSPIVVNKFAERKFSKSEDVLNRHPRPVREPYVPKSKRTFESIRGRSKSTQRLDEIGENNRVKSLRNEYKTRSHENLSTADYVNARDFRRPFGSTQNGYKHRSQFIKRDLDDLREGPNDDYDTDISQVTNSQLESKYYKETRTTQRYLKKQALHDDYDSSPPRIRVDRGGYNSSRYDSDTTARDSIRCETRFSDSSRGIRKEYRKVDDDPKKPLRRSRNRLDYLDDSDARDSLRGKTSNGRLETFDEPPSRPPRVHHESKLRHMRHETRGHIERRHRETRLSDPDRKDRLADSGIENDYRRDSQEADRREPLESEDEGFATLQFIKHERRHTDRNMNLTPSEKRKYDKYVIETKTTVTSKPPSGADKKYEKKAVKKSGTMSKVKQLFSKKEKKAKEAKEEKNKKNFRSSSSGAHTDDEVMTRYREYRGDQLRSARSARDLGSDINQVSLFLILNFLQNFNFIFTYSNSES